MKTAHELTEDHQLIAHALNEARQFIMNTEHGVKVMMNLKLKAVPYANETTHRFLVDLVTEAINVHGGSPERMPPTRESIANRHD